MTVERLGGERLETLRAGCGFGRAEFVVCGEVGGEGGGRVAVRAAEVADGDGDDSGHEERGEAECFAGGGGVGGLGTWEGRFSGGLVCVEIVLDAEFLWGDEQTTETGASDGPRSSGSTRHRRS